MLKQPRGVTLMEIIIATVIFSLVIGISFLVTMRTTNSFHQQIQEANLADKSEKMLKAMEDELGDATLIASTTDPNSTGVFNVYFQGPYWSWGSPPYPANANPYNGFMQAEIRYKVPMRYVSPVNNPRGYSVFITPPVIAYDANGNALNSPTFANDYEFRLRYGWRDNMRFVGNADDNGNLVPLQGPGLHVQSSFMSSIPSGVDAFSGSTLIDNVTYAPGTLKSGYMSYRFQPDQTVSIGKYGRYGFISEAEEGIDFDGDGQLNTYYAIGYLERSYWVGDPGYEQLVPDSRYRVGESVIMQPLLYTGQYPPPNPDQLRSNRIFNRDPNNPARLNVFLWMMSMSPDGKLHFLQSKVALFLRNNATYVSSSSATGTN